MCDDFFDDDMDGLDDNYSAPGNDFQEDRADDAGGEWYKDEDSLVDEQADNTFSDTPDEERAFDQTGAFILGSMIVGNAYESTLDRIQTKKIKKK